MNFFARIFKRKPKTKHPEGKQTVQQAANLYALAPFLFLGFQGIAATLGAFHLVFPTLPSPVSFQTGRAIHLNLSILWPLLGIMGASFYFLVEAVNVDLWKPKLAKFNFWFFLATFSGILLSLALGFSEGREYLEATRPFDILLLLNLALFFLILLGTAKKAGFTSTPLIPILLTGTFLSLMLYSMTVFFTGSPTADELFKYLVVHLWEEGTVEVLAATVLTGLLISTGLPRKPVENLLLLEAGLVIFAGFMATGHHYYWIGAPGFWRFIGVTASIIQVIPILLMVHLSWKHYKINKLKRTKTERLSLNFIYASMFWNLTGAGFFGLIIAIPALSRFAHGTYLTSAHAHMALFGFLGQLVLGTSYFILFRYHKIPVSHYHRVTLSWLLINVGLGLMAVALTTAGLLQTYLWRVAGHNFDQVNLLLKPYLLGRALGGACFAAGGILLAWEIIKLVWKQVSAKFKAA